MGYLADVADLTGQTPEEFQQKMQLWKDKFDIALVKLNELTETEEGRYVLALLHLSCDLYAQVMREGILNLQVQREGDRLIVQLSEKSLPHRCLCKPHVKESATKKTEPVEVRLIRSMRSIPPKTDSPGGLQGGEGDGCQ